jgi:hypothetical protein
MLSRSRATATAKQFVLIEGEMQYKMKREGVCRGIEGGCGYFGDVVSAEQVKERGQVLFKYLLDKWWCCSRWSARR